MTAEAGPAVVRTVADLRRRIRVWRDSGDTIALVPTMGALHDGHLALCRRAGERADRICATLFVNPTQFGPNEDFAAYPRDEDADRAKLAGAGVELVFAPDVAEMYAQHHATRVVVEELGDVLEGRFRPGFFTGVATVVTKLLLQALPDVALFGEKDYQQLQVIRRVVADLNIPVEVEGVPTVRDADGLALSSRNAYLTADERRVAPALHRALVDIAVDVSGGGAAGEAVRRNETGLLEAGFGKVDYLAVCDAGTLAPVKHLDDLAGRPGRVLGAAWLGRARLIDNVPL